MIVNKTNYEAAIKYIEDSFSDRIPKKLKDQFINLRAGWQAEKQIAYKLKSFFGNSNKVYVINNLKLTVNDTAIQIDHLVFTQSNYYLIESKSVAGSLSVNEHGEWCRLYGEHATPIDSPVEQVKRQFELFKLFMAENVELFLGKLLGLQKRTGTYTGHYYVAVSKGSIAGAGRLDFKDIVMKADQVVSKVLDHCKSTHKGFVGALLSTKDEDFNNLNEKEFLKFSEFLMEKNESEDPLDHIHRVRGAYTTPKPKGVEPSVSYSEPKVETGATVTRPFACKGCSSANLRITSGRFGYYFKCLDCDENTAIKVMCVSCGERLKIHTKKGEYFVSCVRCQTCQPFGVNNEGDRTSS